MSPMLLRWFHKLLGMRLASVPVSERQKGFRSFDGVSEAVLSLKAILKRHRDRLEPLCLAFLDIQKAFDSASHSALIRSAGACGVPPPLAKYLGAVHSRNVTTLKCDPFGRAIAVNQGLRQGDPLSTYLFNFLIETCGDTQMRTGISFGGETRSLTHLADDTVVYAKTPAGLQRNVDLLVEQLGACGMVCNAAKCATIQLITNRRTKQWRPGTQPILRVGAKYVPTLGLADTYKYLGVRLGVGFTDSESLLPQLTEKLERLSPAHFFLSTRCTA